MLDIRITIINPITFPGWDELLLGNPNYSFFHSSGWARVLYESYKYKPLYFALIENGELSALIPVMEVKSFLTGRRGICLPFTDHCPIIVSDESRFQKILNHIIDYGKKADWKYLELRDGRNSIQDMTSSMIYYTHSLALTQNEHELLSTFRNSTKRNIKKAIREGVSVDIYNSLESIKAFYQLNCMTRKHHGLPPQPFIFFKRVFEHLISRGHGFVVLASFAQEVIAGAVFFHFGKKAVFKYGASDRKYHHLRPNNLVMWEGIKWYAEKGFRSLNLGRTMPSNTGLTQFKRGWGAKERIIMYHKYDFRRDLFVSEHSKLKSFHNRLFNISPIIVARFVGSILYKHIG